MRRVNRCFAGDPATSVKITDHARIPDEFKRVRVEMPLKMWEQFVQRRFADFPELDKIPECFVDLPRVQAALEEWGRTPEQPCPDCENGVIYNSDIQGKYGPCPTCDQRGTIRTPSPCPGAELIR